MTTKQKRIIEILKKYPHEMIMHDGYLTGGHGIKFDKRSLNALENKGVLYNGKLNQTT